MGIEPIGGEAAPYVYTEHRTLRLETGDAEEPQEVGREQVADRISAPEEMVGQEDSAAVVDETSSQQTPFNDEVTVRAGDRVLISYNISVKPSSDHKVRLDIWRG